jgi:hypothetical protein
MARLWTTPAIRDTKRISSIFTVKVIFDIGVETDVSIQQ